SSLEGTVLVARDKQRPLVVLTLLAFGVNVGLNFALLPRLGIKGAAIVWVVSELVLVIGGAYLVRRDIGQLPSLRLTAKVLPAVAILVGVGAGLSGAGLPWVIAAMLAAA